MTKPRAERDLEDLESVFAALANASRRHILQVLQFRGGSMSAGEIAGRFSCSWPTTTRHLQTLQAAGLVRVKRQGRQRIYALDRARLRKVTGSWLNTFHPTRRTAR